MFSRHRPLTTRLLLASTKGVALCSLATLALLSGPLGPPSAAPEPHRSEAHGCTYDEVPAGAVPTSALIRTEAGRVREVPFEIGWDVYNGRRAGELIAVCLGS